MPTVLDYSEDDVSAKLITPALARAGWDEAQIRRQYSYAPGRVIVRGRLSTRGKPKRVDFLLFHQHLPLAVIEAKRAQFPVGHGLQQALAYAEALDAPFVFASNGLGFRFHDRTGAAGPVETDLAMDAFPSPAELWERYRRWKGWTAEQERIVLQPFHDDGLGKEPRYYQRNAINAAVEAIARGQQRLLLVMATGTGKTYTAFQIIWRLWKSSWRAGKQKRVLFLADRNVLVNQTMVNDFRPFGAAMAKLSTASKTIERSDGSRVDLTLALDGQRRIDTAYEIYLGLYQALTGPEERDQLYREFSPGFFDLIVIDECHRGSAAEDSAWRDILNHFSGAVQIGLTATPRETAYASNIDYFGPPVYSYSLKQGIRDGYLAPYKVIKVHLDIDVHGYRPQKGETDRHGELIEDRLYNRTDYDRTLVIDSRTERVAQWITAYLKDSGERMQKTIIFCVDTEHADLMRKALVNANPDLVQQNGRYVMRITGDDAEGVAQLDNFIDPESAWPVIVTTSRLLSTGVDAQTCRLIVLDRPVGSMTEFKQIVGRGTRIHAGSNKLYFTLVDFRGASSHFADPDFDGEPVQIYTPGDGDPTQPPDPIDPNPAGGDDGSDPDAPDPRGPGVPEPLDPSGPAEPRAKYYIDGRPVTVATERVEYLDADGKLVTESLRDYSRQTIRRQYGSLDAFLRHWQGEARKQAVLDELAEAGLPVEPLLAELGRDLDPFDLICHLAYDQPPLTRRERALGVKKRDAYTRHGEQARAVLAALLDKYQDEGMVDALDNLKMLEVPPLNALGTTMQLIKCFGSKAAFLDAVHALQAALYEASA
ncbi:MAG: DEAD/DEAH box helicase family protein [Xanthomonadales bacterium]|jgi:type I restriction enzyme R subunit|nr:DEAD/DEAH box helicase family protein [Xanthomonadales bacterium]